MLLERQDLRRMADIGWLATQRGMLPQAHRIFEALRLARPDSAAGFIGAAMAYLRAKDMNAAVSILDRAFKTVEPGQHPELHAFRGLALRLAGRASECEQSLKQAGDLPLGQVLQGRRPELIKE